MTTPKPKILPTLTPLSTQQGGFFGKLFFLVFLVGSGYLGVYAYDLNKVIVQKFENRRWDIPARVYSRPLELEENARISKTDLENWLSLLHYRKTDNTDKVGTYSIQKNTYTIHTRGFDYGDGDIDTAHTLKIRFKDNRIVHLDNQNPNRQTPFARLEPIQIGGIFPDSNEDRVLVGLDETPKTLIDALIATEDRGFYEHYGVSIRGTTRAIINNIRGGSRQGGSTLTQQLVKNFYLTSERSLKRKVNEALMAILLELHYSKDDILKVYINEINLGQNGNRSINGFGIASQFYFNRPLNELRLDQQALLVGLAKGSSYYNPRKHPERAKERRNIVLHNMLVTGKISQEDYDEAIAYELDITDNPSIAKPKFPDFLDYVQRELNNRYHPDDLKKAGLRIISTLDPLAQISADKAMSNRLPKLGKKLQGALVSANPHTGEVLALVGSRSDFTGFNRAIDAKRQVGSLLKPVIYLMALQSGEYNLASAVDDSEKIYKVGNKNWSPKNYGGVSHGDVPMMVALANSYNQSAVNTGMSIGLEHYIKFLKQMGIKEKIPEYPSILLGAVDLSPMQMLGLYQIFATGGTHYPLHSINTVINERGQILQKASQTPNARLPADATYLTNYAMQQVIKNGTAKSALSLGEHLNLAGKTGTTNDERDAWFAGYSGNYVTIVWVGRDDNKPIKLTGGSGALPIWIDYMQRLKSKLTPVNLPKPDNIEMRWLENGTGYMTDPDCPNAIELPVIPESIPSGDSACVADQKEYERQMELAERHKEETVSFDEVDDTPSDEAVTGDEFSDISPSN